MDNPSSGRRKIRPQEPAGNPSAEDEQIDAHAPPAPHEQEAGTPPPPAAPERSVNIPSPPPFDAFEPLEVPNIQNNPAPATQDPVDMPPTPAAQEPAGIAPSAPSVWGQEDDELFPPPPVSKIFDETLASRWHVRHSPEGDMNPVRHVDLELSRDDWSQQSVQAANAIDAAIKDNSVSEIKGNSHRLIFLKRNGVNEPLNAAFGSEAEYNSFIEQMVVESESIYSWDDLTERRSGVLQMASGDSLTVILPPVAKETNFIVRKHNLHTVEPGFFIDNGTMTQAMMEFLSGATKAKVNMLFVGDVGAGKTTILNTLTRFINPRERVGIIEQVPELQSSNDDTVYWTFQPMATAETGTSLYDVLDIVLYSRINRLIIGEIHDEGLTKMLKVMIKGTEGVFSTYHATDVDDAVERLKIDLQLENRNMTSDTALRLIRRSIELVVVMGVVDGKHRVVEIAEIDWRQASAAETAARTTLFKWDAAANAHKVGKSGPNDGGSVRKKFAKHRENLDDSWFHDPEQYEQFINRKR